MLPSSYLIFIISMAPLLYISSGLSGSFVRHIGHVCFKELTRNLCTHAMWKQCVQSSFCVGPHLGSSRPSRQMAHKSSSQLSGAFDWFPSFALVLLEFIFFLFIFIILIYVYMKYKCYINSINFYD